MRFVADLMAAAAVAGRLAACAQVGGQVDSTYWWRSGVETSTEWSVQFKTAPDRSTALVGQIRVNHPYEVPEILVSWWTAATRRTRPGCTRHPDPGTGTLCHTRLAYRQDGPVDNTGYPCPRLRCSAELTRGCVGCGLGDLALAQVVRLDREIASLGREVERAREAYQGLGTRLLAAQRQRAELAARPQQVEERALARPARSDDRHHLAPGHPQVDRVEHGDDPAVAADVRLPEGSRFEDRHSRIASTGRRRDACSAG